MQKYIEIALGSVGARNTVVPLQDAPRYIQMAGKSQELYRSYFLYDEDILAHMRSHRTIKSFPGKYYLSHLVFDIDRGDKSLSETRQHAIAFVEKLKEEWIEELHIQVSFSGRGFHITTPDLFGFAPDHRLPEIAKATCRRYFPEADDLWYGTSLIRVMNTVNLKSGLFKVPLSMAELYHSPVEDIQKLALHPRRDFEFEVPVEPYKPEHQSKIIVPQEEEAAVQFRRATHQKADPTGIATCMQRVFLKGGEEGTRHKEALRLVSAWRRNGIPREAIVLLLQGWAPDWDVNELERIVANVFEKGYQYKCTDPVMKEYCDPRCIFYQRKNFSLDVQSAEQAEGSFKDFIRTDFSSRSFNLADVYRLDDPFWTLPGELIILSGPTKLGKTAWLQNLAISLPHLRCLYVNTEIAAELLFRRFVQTAYGITKHEVVEHYQISSNTFSSRLSHVMMLSQTPTFGELKRAVAEHQPQLVIIDSTEGVIVDPTRDKFTNETRLILGLRDLAREQSLIIIAMVHIRKGGDKDLKGDGRRITMDDIKGASANAQQADKVIAFEGKMMDSYRTVKALAARDESSFELKLKYDWRKFQFIQEVEDARSI